MKSFSRVLAIAGLSVGFAFAANATTVRSTANFEGDLMQCGGCGKGKKDGDKKEDPKQQSAWVGGFQADVMHCGSCGKDKKTCPKDGDKDKDKECPKDGKKTSTMSNCGDCNKDKKECPKDKDKDKDKQTADNDKKDEGCGGCGKKKQS